MNRTLSIKALVLTCWLLLAAGIPLQTVDAYTHTVLVEEGTATWCGYCPSVVGWLGQIYASGQYDFHFLALVDDVNPYAAARLDELGLTGFPTCFGDGGYTGVVGALGIAPLQSMINTCGYHAVDDVDLEVSAGWLGSGQISVSVDVTNNHFMQHTWYLRVYITEIDSRWSVFGTQYHYAMVGNYAMAQNVTVNGGVTNTFTATWNGNNYGVGDIQQDNIKVIATVFDLTTDFAQETAVAYPELPGNNVVVELTYQSGSPVPAAGGDLVFDVYLENQDLTALDFDAWLETAYEGGAPTTVVQRYFTGYQPGWTINRPGMFFPVPASYAAGNYTLTAKAGNHPSEVWDESGFPFVKSGVADAVGFTPFVPDDVPDIFGEPDENIVTSILPDAYRIDNYPNPFNPSTTIRYSLPADGKVQLAVYDVKGRQVATIVEGYRTAGQHEVTFDAAGLPSGVYLYRMTADDFVTSGKMILMK